MAGKRSGLGKGLDALIADTNTEKKAKTTKSNEQESLISINKIEPNKEQPRKHFEEDALLELSESIKQYGIIQPLVVAKSDNGYYKIIAGERRWRAAKMAGLKEVPVVVKNFTDIEIAEISLIENIQREDLNPIEEAVAYKRLMEEFNLKHDEVAEKVSKSRATITNALRLLNLDERVQKMLIEDMISMGHARALLSLNDGDKQYDVANKIFDNKLSVREVEKLVKNYDEKKPEKKETPVKDFILTDLENNLKDILGSKVNICDKEGKGKIEIEYYSKEDLDRIYDLLYSINK